MKRFTLLVLLLISGKALFAQELQATVNVNLTNLSAEDRKNWETFKTDVEAYLNAYSWTTNYQGEKIQATFNFNILPSGVELFVSSRRPIYKSSESTVMARFLDANLSFGYSR